MRNKLLVWQISVKGIFISILHLNNIQNNKHLKFGIIVNFYLVTSSVSFLLQMASIYTYYEPSSFIYLTNLNYLSMSNS